MIFAVLLFAVSSCSTTQYHYDVRRDRSVWFTNSDEVIDTVRKAFTERSPRITVTYRSGSDDMPDIPSLMNELIMYALSETDDPAQGDYIFHQYGGYDLSYTRSDGESGYVYEITVEPRYYTTPAQESEVDSQVNEILAELSLTGRTDREKVETVYNYVYDNVKYDRVHKNKKLYHLKTTAYAALVNGYAVCQGYSVLMYRLLRESGVNCRVITGQLVTASGSEFHAWNIAELDGVYYNIDVTWDVQTGTHEMFLKGEGEFSQTHIRDEMYRTEAFRQQYPMSE